MSHVSLIFIKNVNNFTYKLNIKYIPELSVIPYTVIVNTNIITFHLDVVP